MSHIHCPSAMSVADFQKSPGRISSADAEVRWSFPSAQSLLRHTLESRVQCWAPRARPTGHIPPSLEGVQWRTTKMDNVLEPLTWAEGGRDSSAWRRPGSGSSYQYWFNLINRGIEKLKLDSSQWPSEARKEALGRDWNSVKRKQKKNLFYCRDGWTLEWGAQRGCGISILWDIQDWTGHSLEEPALVDKFFSEFNWKLS